MSRQYPETSGDVSSSARAYCLSFSSPRLKAFQYRVLGAILTAGLLTSTGMAASVTVSDKLEFAARGGEVQSTVVAPGLKTECPAGRILTSIDLRIKQTPMPKGAILGRDLDHPESPTIEAVIDKPINPDMFSFGNDHDLFVLKNGDVVLTDMVSTVQPVDPKPLWFDQTFRDGSRWHDGPDFGPGARTGLMAWRSTDCGQTFHYASFFDPATAGDRTCGFPQKPGPTAHHPLDMGGSDGPMTFYAPRADRIYSVFQCVGSKPDPAIKDKFVLSAQRLNTSVILESTDEASSWHLLGTFPKAAWRRSAVAPDKNEFILTLTSGVAFGERGPDGNLVFSDQAVQIPGFTWGFKAERAHELEAVHANLWASNILTLLPGHTKKLVLAIPANVPGTAGAAPKAGYRIFIYDGLKKAYAEIAPAVPASASPDAHLLHLGIINIGTGPLLVYWSEFDVETLKAQVRGRFIFNEAEYSSDFVVNRVNGMRATWDLKPKARYWYGDYQTAFGFEQPVAPGAKTRTFDYYPLWIEPTGRVPFAHVSVTVPQTDRLLLGSISGPDALKIEKIPSEFYKIAPNVTKLSALPDIPQIGEEEDDHDDAMEAEDPDKDRDEHEPGR